MEYGTCYTCTVCGSEEDFHTMRDTEEGCLIVERQLCFTCAFWTHKIEHPVENRAIINGRHYVVHPGTDQGGPFLGFGGRYQCVAYRDGRTVQSNNVWHQGEIPERFRAQLPDDAQFIVGAAPQKVA